MAHPYAYPPTKSGFHHQYRTQASTPSSSVSHLSVIDVQPAAGGSSFGAHLPSFDDSVSSGSASHIPIAAGDPEPSSVISTTGPERRRRRSTRGPPKSASRKKSGEGVFRDTASAKADPSEPLIPTRTYQFKSFDSFASVPTPLDAAPVRSPFGVPYTSLAPPSSDSSSVGSSLAVFPTTVTDHTNTPGLKKATSLLNVGKRVVKEVLGGGGNNSQKPDTKVVYYGRGGAGGGSTRLGKPGSPTEVQPFPTSTQSQGPGDSGKRSSSYYTAASSAYTPSILSSPYPESIASSPYATSVDDGSVYGGSAHSAPHTGSSRRPSSRPSPTHRSVSPAALSDSRRDSIVSSFPGTPSASDAEDAYERAAYLHGHRQHRAYRASSQRQMSLPIDENSSPIVPTVNYPASMLLQESYTMPQANLTADFTTASEQRVHPPLSQYGTPYSTCPPTPATRVNATTSEYLPSSNSSPSPSPQLPNAHSTPGPSVDAVHAFLAQAQLQAAQLQTGYVTASRTLTDTRSGSSETVSHNVPVSTPSPSSLQGWSGKQPDSAPSSTHNHAPGAVSRPLPDPLAQAVGQLSLIQNPMNVGWPRPQPVQHTWPQAYTNMSYTASSSADVFIPGTAMPGYILPPPSTVVVTTVPPPAPTLPQQPQQPGMTPETLAFLRAEAEHRMLQRKIAELERIQQIQQIQLQQHQLQQQQQQQPQQSSSLSGFNTGYGTPAP